MLTARQLFLKARLEYALFFGGLAGLIALVLAGVVFWGKDDIPLYSGFPEWNSTPGDPCPCDMPTDRRVGEESELAESLGEHFDNMASLIRNVIRDFIWSQEERHVAGLVRTYAVVAVFLALFVGYRRHLKARYEAEERPAQLAQLPVEVRLIDRLVIATGAVGTSYVLLSGLWVVTADMFEELTLGYVGASVVTGLFVGVTSFVVTYWATTLTSRDLVSIGLLSFGVGMAGGFAIAGQAVREGDPTHWWEVAVSAAGRSPGAELFFMFTLVNLALLLYVLWIDVRGLLRMALPTAKPVWPPLRRLFPPDTPDVEIAYQTIRVAFIFSLFGVASVGVFPLIEQGNTLTLIVTGILHSGGAGSAMLIILGGGMVVLTDWLPDAMFPWHFKWLSRFGGLICLALALLFVLGEVIGEQTIGVTALELIYFAVMSLWLYGAVDGLVRYTNRLRGFDARLAAFWATHPAADGWQITTAIDAADGATATITHHDAIVSTGAAPGTDEAALRTAILMALDATESQ